MGTRHIYFPNRINELLEKEENVSKLITSLLEKYYAIENKNGKSEQQIIEDILKRYNINLEKLKEEQIKLSKTISLKDEINFSLAERIAGIESVFFQNKIISAIVVLDSKLESLEQEYFEDKIKFPYIPGFKAYRELPSMIQAFQQSIRNYLCLPSLQNIVCLIFLGWGYGPD